MNNTLQSNRRQFIGGALGAAGLAAMPTWANAIGANDEVRVAVIGFNGRGKGHIGSLLAIKGVRITALCDVDQKVMDKQVADFKKKNIEVKQYSDYRKLLEDKDVDAVTIATPNHSHTLIALAALAAGKHVYVEKPVCHNPIEGRKLLEASAVVLPRGQILQHGMQRRSSPGWAEAVAFAQSGQIGKVTLSRGINYKARKSIGKTAAPAQPDANGRIAGTFRDTGGKPQIVDVDYKLWSAPRPVAPMQREQFHYDWHWQWAYGNGDIGNQGPHQLDVARWALGNPTLLPKRVMSFGGRWGYQDDGQTANNQMAFYNYEPAPLLFDNRGLPSKDMNWKPGYEPVYLVNGKAAAARIGNVIHCEGGFVAEGKAYDNDGKQIKKFDNFNDGADHMKNFIDSIRAGKLVNDNLHVSHGYHAAALAHLANASFRLGKQMSNDEIRERLSNDKAGQETFEHFVKNLEANQINMATDKIVVGPWLDYDPQSNQFTGEFAAEANKLFAEEYAPGFELPTVS
ncbi:MAG: Gfo/Idh/MocA family oxidoreductase [Verrucomicrobiaceae bacterium]|nr:Gfo/Idh/MocA family oxidoreductase [Verrucomicrobiaceae bacterium]